MWKVESQFTIGDSMVSCNPSPRYPWFGSMGGSPPLSLIAPSVHMHVCKPPLALSLHQTLMVHAPNTLCTICLGPSSAVDFLCQ